MQTPFASQQPSGHTWGLHAAGVVHAPPVAASESAHVPPTDVQSAHAAPLRPHAVDEDPARHWLPEQQPAQFAAPQVVIHFWPTQA